MNEEQNKESLLSTDDNQQQEQPLNTILTDEPIVPAAEITPNAEQPSTLNLSTEALAKVDENE